MEIPKENIKKLKRLAELKEKKYEEVLELYKKEFNGDHELTMGKVSGELLKLNLRKHWWDELPAWQKS